MSGVWAWIRRWGRLVFGAVASVLLGLLGAGWLWRRRRRELGAVRDELAVAEAQRDIAALTARRDALIGQANAKDSEVAEIDEALATNRRRIVEAHDGAEAMTDDEVEDAFASLGYLIPLTICIRLVVDVA